MQKVNIAKLKGAIVEHGYTIDALAMDIGLSRATMHRKLKSAGKFTIDDIEKIVNVLKLQAQEAMEIFFPTWQDGL
ncbi:TPA: helix-turn-helix transcriptional regulator [Streptococcus suis]|nr:helix-turn-helix transcriptional regulator [Streptococcus suis]